MLKTKNLSKKISNVIKSVVKKKSPYSVAIQKAKARNILKREVASLTGNANAIRNAASAAKIAQIKNKNFAQLRQVGAAETSYKKAILLPEISYDCRVPQQFGQQTVSLHRHLSIPVTASATTGALLIVVNPTIVSDNTAALSGIAVVGMTTASGTYDALSTFPIGAVVPENFSLPAGNVTGTRMVSFASTLLPQSSNLNVQGKITGCVYQGPASLFPPIVANATAFPAASTVAFGTLSNVDNQYGGAIANVGEQMGLRTLYTPIDIQDFEIWPINTYEGTENATAIIPYHIFIVTGAAVSSPFTLELFMNFEAVPVLGGILTGMGKFSTENVLPSSVLIGLKMNPNLLCHPTKSDASFMGNFRNNNNKPADFLPSGGLQYLMK
jgi:hypothetical protein